jgi:hypothetical protein
MLKKKLNAGENIDSNDIIQKESEIEILAAKLDELGSLSAIRPEINKKIINTAEMAYNILLRNDFYPSKLYQEICSLLNIKTNSYEKRSYENRSYENRSYENRSYENRSYENRSYEKKPYENKSYENKSYENRFSDKKPYKPTYNSNENIQIEQIEKKKSYIPPGFRKENIVEEKKIEPKNDYEFIKDKTPPALIKNLGVWNKPSEAIFKGDTDPIIKKESINDDWETIQNDF